jgi:hypothetical protein
LLKALEQAGHHIRCLARRPAFLSPRVAPTTAVVAGDVLDREVLPAALNGVQTAYYLIHSMGSRGAFDEEDRRLDHQAVRAVILVGGVNEAFHFASIQPLDCEIPRARRFERQPATNPFHDVFGLVVSQMMFAPEPECLVDDLSQVFRGLHLCLLTTQLGAFSPLLSRHEDLPRAECCAVSTIDAVGTVPGIGLGGQHNLPASHQQGDTSPGVTSLTEVFGTNRNPDLKNGGFSRHCHKAYAVACSLHCMVRRLASSFCH